MFTAATLAVATRVPVAPAAGSVSSASSTATFFGPDPVLMSARSTMPAAGVIVALMAVPKAPTSTDPGTVDVTDGAVIDVEELFFLAPDVSTGVVVFTPP